MRFAWMTLLAVPSLLAQSSGDWPMYNHDLAGTRYSPLAQITTKNVANLKQAWSYKLRSPSDAGKRLTGIGGFSEATPIVVSGVMYLPAGGRIVALEPETGKELWSYEPKDAIPSRRGVTYWPGDKDTPPRVIFTTGQKMMALNAKTGQVVPGFGNEGIVDLVVPYDSAPTIFKNMLLVGANVQEQPATGPAGDSRAYDVRTGAKLWEFHSVPRPGEPGHEVWQGDDWKNRSGVNNWGFSMTADEARDIIYMTFGSPASDYYGADRKGPDLFGNSVVAMDAKTGKYKWHFQVVHHDLWDQDLPPAPGLVDITKDGRKIPALAQVGKSGWMFILDRVTGKPVFGVEERPVPQSDVPGEQTSPTQPFPLKPPALARNSFKEADIVTAEDTTPEHAKACRELYEASGGLYNAGPFTPYLYHQPGTMPKSTAVFPGSIGGSNWGGTATDPKLGYVFVNTSDEGSIGWIEKLPAGSRVEFDRRSQIGALPRFWDKKVDGNGLTKGESSWPCQKPPWGRLMAVNANTGEFAWSVPLGITDELPPAKQKTGRMNLGGPIVTAGGLVFIGASNDRRFRAFDSKSGKELWVTKLDYSAISVPMTYRGKNGKQYVAVIATGGSGITDPNPGNTESLVVFALP
jgi:quinoprotein glucose dehydrogenase